MSSRVFRPYRAVGLVADHVPHVVRFIHKRNEHLVVTCVGRSFHTYGCDSLRLLSVSEPHEADIEAMAADRQYVYTVVGTTVRAWLRGTQLVHSYSQHPCAVHLVLPLGAHLLTVDSHSSLRLWDIASCELYTQIDLDNDKFRVTCVLHPSTYVNKVLLGSQQGALQLWNVMRSTLVYTFTGWNSSVLVLQQAPAVDTVAVALQDGHIHVHNVRVDHTLMSFCQHWGPATALAFRTDGPPVMVSASAHGHLALWDLEQRRLTAQMWQAHDAAVAGLSVLHAQPLMLTSSADNTLKMWLFDMPDGSGRLLRVRDGHAAPPTIARFYGQHGSIVSSAGDSCLRAFSADNDAVNRSFGRASFNRKLSKKRRLGAHDTLIMPPVVQFSCEPARGKQWDDIVAVHAGLCQATTWSYDKQRMGAHRLAHERFSQDARLAGAVCTCCELSACGNFVVLGYSSGHVDKFNVQSGAWRGAVGGENDQVAHEGGVRGVASTALVRQVVTAGADCRLVFWRFKTGRRLNEVPLSCPPARLTLHRRSGLAAVALDDFSLLLVDVAARAIARTFSSSCGGPITDMCLSPDAHWLLAASRDGCVRVWSVARAALIDVLRTPHVVTSLAFEPSGRLLATTHVDQLGVFLWANVTVFESVVLPPLPDNHVPVVCQVPTAMPEMSSCQEDDAEEAATDPTVTDDPDCLESVDQIAERMLTLSQLPESRWAHVLSLDWIRRRNKPNEPQKAPPPAPFFLPTVPGLTPKFAAPVSSDHVTAQEEARVQHASHVFAVCRAAEMLEAEDGGSQFLAHVKCLGTSELEATLSDLRPGWPHGDCTHARLFLRFVLEQIDSGRNFELMQAWLALFLKLHGSALVEYKQMHPLLVELQQKQNTSWKEVSSQIDTSLCLIGFLRSSTVG